jgi:hypothetical protein
MFVPLSLKDKGAKIIGEKNRTGGRREPKEEENLKRKRT